MKAAVVPAVSSSWQIQDVPQAQPVPNQVLVEVERVVWRLSTQNHCHCVSLASSLLSLHDEFSPVDFRM
jgi:hypothetical protein